MRKITLTSLNLYTIVRDLLINAWVIVLALITGFVGSACYYSFLNTKTYSCGMTVSINLSGYTSEATALSLARTVVIAENLDDVFQSNALKDVVEKDLGEKLTGKIQAYQLEETNLVRITVTDTSPEKAYETLVSVYDNYYKVTDYVFTNVIIRTVVNPEMPLQPTGSISPIAGGVIFGLLSALIVTGIIILLSIMRDTVKNVSDVESELGTKLFATVGHIKPLGRDLPPSKRRMIVTNPLISPHFANCFRKIAVKLESMQRSKGVKTVMITSVTENEGKTSVAVNIAITLAQNGHSVLILDGDFKNPSVFRFFDNIENPEHADFYNYFNSATSLSQYIKREPLTGLSMLGNAKAYSGSAEILSSSQFSSVLEELKSMFDFVIVDTPPCGITVDAEIISNIVDVSLLVVRQDVVTVADINDQIENIDNGRLAGCIFNDVAVFGRREESIDGYYIDRSTND